MEKKSWLERDRLRKKMIYKIVKEIKKAIRKPSATYPKVEKLKTNPFSVATMLDAKYLNRKIFGINKTIVIIVKIFVDVFILIVWEKVFIVCNKILHNMSKCDDNNFKEKIMEEKEEITKYLNAIYQNTRTAIQSIDEIIKKATSKEFISELSNEEDAYSVLAKECENFAKAEKIEGLKDNNFIEKAKLWTSINMSTLMDDSDRKIAELMLFGTFMGVITCIKDKNDHEGVSSELDEILDKLTNLERQNIENLIPFLKEKK